MTRKPTAIEAVQLIQDAFNQPNVTSFGLSEARALFALLEGYADWAEAASMLALAEIKFSSEDIKNWPVYVIYQDETVDPKTGWDVVVDKVLPKGASIKNRRHPFYDGLTEFGAIVLPDAFSELSGTLRAQAHKSSMVLRAIFSTIPRVDRYGLPSYAQESTVKEWADEEQLWSCLDDQSRHTSDKRCDVDVSFIDVGDDSVSRYWAEVAVHPDVAAVIEMAFSESAPDAVCPLRAKIKPADNVGDLDSSVHYVHKTLEGVFCDSVGLTLLEMWGMLENKSDSKDTCLAIEVMKDANGVSPVKPSSYAATWPAYVMRNFIGDILFER